LIPKMIMVTKTIMVASSDRLPAPHPTTEHNDKGCQNRKHWGAKILSRILGVCQ